MPLHRITTPEQVHFHYSVAGLATRGAAWALDQFILAAAFVCILFTAFFSGMALGLTIVFLARFAIDFGYHTWFELRRGGQTPGKRAMGIRVISSRGGKLRFADVLTRTLFRVVDNPFLIPFVGFVGAVTALIDPLRRRLGDLAADTIVVRDVRVDLPPALLEQQSRVNTFAADAQIRQRIQARATRHERDLMLDLMLRRDHLDPDTREVLFRQAAAHFRHRYNLPGDLDYLSDEQTVLNTALVIQSTSLTG